MQNKLTIINNIFFVLLPWLCSCEGNQNIQAVPSQQKVPLQYKALIVKKNFNDSTWGYVIEFNSRTIIQQFAIPALEGNKLFKTKLDATLTGNLVAGKLNHSLRPTITKKELDSLGIIY